MTLTRPDFRLERANPSPAYITDAEWWLWLRLQELEPGTKLGGIYADKSGYHNTGQRNLDRWPGNYSVRDAADRTGPAWRTKAAALDWTFPDAQRGDFSTIDGYTARVIRSGLDPADPRLDLILREVYGQADTDRDVEGYDERREARVSSDPSHLWHMHFSFIRSRCHDFWGMWALLTVLMGWDVARWRASLPATAPQPAPKPPAPKPPAGLPVHRLGSRVLRNTSPDMKGTDVQLLQRFIGRLTADGVYGSGTERRVREYQRMRGYRVDGVAGPQTLGPIVKALGI
jgi:peptidoglycan hydrolase-like protein with peptidoglycan-binding domain